MEFTRSKMLVSSFLLFLLFGCNNSGFELQRFEASNHGLDSIINIISKGYCSKCKENQKKVIVLDFTVDKDSNPEFWFSFHEKDELRDFYIFHLNRRIIGYIVKNNVEIFLLSNIARKDIFEKCFWKFIYPTNENRKFYFLYFPSNQYKQSEEMTTPYGRKTICRWPSNYGIHDYVYIYIKYINNRFVECKSEDRNVR